MYYLPTIYSIYLAKCLHPRNFLWCFCGFYSGNHKTEGPGIVHVDVVLFLRMTEIQMPTAWSYQRCEEALIQEGYCVKSTLPAKPLNPICKANLSRSNY